MTALRKSPKAPVAVVMMAVHTSLANDLSHIHVFDLLHPGPIDKTLLLLMQLWRLSLLLPKNNMSQRCCQSLFPEHVLLLCRMRLTVPQCGIERIVKPRTPFPPCTHAVFCQSRTAKSCRKRTSLLDQTGNRICGTSTTTACRVVGPSPVKQSISL